MSMRYEFIALRRLNAVARQSRKLHMTGPATYPSKFLAPKAIVSLRELESRSADKVNAANAADGRSFNTSRELKRNKDWSTMDFTFFPGAEIDEQTEGMRMLRFNDAAYGDASAHVHTPSVAKPRISTTSLDMPISPMSDVHDNTSVDIDFHTVTEQVNRAASMASIAGEPAEARAGSGSGTGSLSSLWNGMVGALVGGSPSTAQKSVP